MVFLKSSKTIFWGHFSVIFAQWGFFPQNLALSHTTKYGPLKLCANSKKTYRQTEEKTEGQTDRQILFYRTIPAEAGGPKWKLLISESIGETSKFDWSKREKYLIDAKNTYNQFYLQFRIFCCLNWIRSYEFILGKVRSIKLNVVLFR